MFTCKHVYLLARHLVSPTGQADEMGAVRILCTDMQRMLSWTKTSTLVTPNLTKMCSVWTSGEGVGEEEEDGGRDGVRESGNRD